MLKPSKWKKAEDYRVALLEERDKTTILRCLNNPAADQAAAFLSAVAAGDPAGVAPGYAEALRIMAVCQAVSISAKEGRPVAVDEIATPGKQGAAADKEDEASPA